MRVFDGERWTDEFHEGETITWRGTSYGCFKPRIEILRIVEIPCQKGRGFQPEMFPQGKAFLCRVENLPFKKLDDNIDIMSKFCVIGNQGPRHQFIDWCLDPPGNYGEGWDESDLFSDTLEEAVANKIQDIENQTKRETLCKYCEEKELCLSNLRSLAEESIKTRVQRTPEIPIY